MSEKAVNDELGFRLYKIQDELPAQPGLGTLGLIALRGPSHGHLSMACKAASRVPGKHFRV